MKKLETKQMESFAAAGSVETFCALMHQNPIEKYRCISRLGGLPPAPDVVNTTVNADMCDLLPYIMYLPIGLSLSFTFKGLC